MYFNGMVVFNQKRKHTNEVYKTPIPLKYMISLNNIQSLFIHIHIYIYIICIYIYIYTYTYSVYTCFHNLVTLVNHHHRHETICKVRRACAGQHPQWGGAEELVPLDFFFPPSHTRCPSSWNAELV